LDANTHVGVLPNPALHRYSNLSAGNEWLKPDAWGSLTEGRTDQKRRDFRPTELCSLPRGTGFSAPYVDAYGQLAAALWSDTVSGSKPSLASLLLAGREKIRFRRNLSIGTLNALGQSSSVLAVPGNSQTILGCADSTVIRTSGTNRVGPVSLAQWNGRDFLFSPLGSGNAQLGEPVDARLLPDAPLIQPVC
jgi:hypothetical protein